jgi:hypothetical protein
MQRIITHAVGQDGRRRAQLARHQRPDVDEEVVIDLVV